MRALLARHGIAETVLETCPVPDSERPIGVSVVVPGETETDANVRVFGLLADLGQPLESRKQWHRMPDRWPAL